jgi:hypothetical protein
MQMGYHAIDEQQKNNTDQESDHCGKKCKLPHLFAHIHGRYQQRPHRSCHHDTGSESGKYSLNIAANLFFQEKHAGCPCSRSQKRNQKTGYNA